MTANSRSPQRSLAKTIRRRRSYSADDVAAIMRGNWLRFFGETLPD